MANMRAMVLDKPGTPLTLRARPAPDRGDIPVAVAACGVCRTDLPGAPLFIPSSS